MFIRFLIVLFTFALGAGPALALQSDCLAMASNQPRIIPTALTETALEADQVKITFIGHSSFIIESPGGTRIVTDYSGYAGGIVPDGVTMNRAHSTHYTDFPDPAIKHVLRGWNPDGDGPAAHDVEIGDIRVRNVTTDIRGGMAGRMKDGNSIFIFEVAGLCIGHLGHLHHLLGNEHVGMIGRLDIVMVPVDGGYTMGQDEMLEVCAPSRRASSSPCISSGRRRSIASSPPWARTLSWKPPPAPSASFPPPPCPTVRSWWCCRVPEPLLRFVNDWGKVSYQLAVP